MARMSSVDYIFDTSTDLGRAHMGYLEHLLDAPTVDCLADLGVQPGQRCLDVGAGGGSITRWLAERVGPAGTVVALDLDIDHIEEQPGVEVHRHDITDGLPDDRTYDLIHARAVLLHLPRREEVLATLGGRPRAGRLAGARGFHQPAARRAVRTHPGGRGAVDPHATPFARAGASASPTARCHRSRPAALHRPRD
jgi:SAM-dependent methyltransferase